MTNENERQQEFGTATPVEQFSAEATGGANKKAYMKPQLTVYGRMQHMTLSGTGGAGVGDGGSLEP
jgi:hypothetical protein